MPHLPEHDRQALLDARHGDPFSVLGLHANGEGGFALRVLLPGAQRVQVLSHPDGATVCELTRWYDSGFFEATLERALDYRLSVQWQHGGSGVYADPYSFDSSLSADDRYYLAEGSHLRPHTVQGAHPMRLRDVDGVRFVVWAPNARRVSVVGYFNAWDGRRHAMRYHPGAGLWEIFVPHAARGDHYKFELLDRAGHLLPLKSDPFAFATEMRPATASVVAGVPPRVPLPEKRKAFNHRQAPVSIYEVHLGSWRRHEDGRWLSWQELAQTLPVYAQDMGFTHLELLPITEHPFDGSWGYQPLGMYAPTSRFGPPEGFTEFVAACHAHDVGVILDWVPAHFPSDPHGLYHFDGTALYDYADPREGFHKDWNTAIYNFSRYEVRNFLIGNALYWLENHGVDGLRVDAVASMLYRDYSRADGEWLPNAHGGRENLEAISLLQRANIIIGEHAPGSITVAEESTAFPGVSSPVYQGGLGFHYKWNMGWMHDTLDYMSQDPVHRKYHHDRMRFGLVYAFTENFVLPISHDEVVHGKGSLLNKMPGDHWQRFANLRAYLGFMWGHPGKKLLFMGCEFGQPTEWNHDAGLPWHLLQQDDHGGVQRLVRDLNALLKSRAALHEFDCDGQGFEWVEVDNADQSIFAFLRRAGERQVLVICNFTPVPRPGYRIGVPATGAAAWTELLNSDSHHYGGSNMGNGLDPIPVQYQPSHGHQQSLCLTLPPLATLILEPHV